jgi:hypothetical protein
MTTKMVVQGGGHLCGASCACHKNTATASRRVGEGDGDPAFLAKIDRLMGRTPVTLPQPLSGSVRAPSVPAMSAEQLVAMTEHLDKLSRDLSTLQLADELAQHPGIVVSVDERGEIGSVVVAPVPYFTGNAIETPQRLRVRVTELTAKLAGAKSNGRIADAQRIEAELAEVQQQLGEAEFPRDQQRLRERRGGDDVPPRYAVEFDSRNGATKRPVVR